MTLKFRTTDFILSKCLCPMDEVCQFVHGPSIKFLSALLILNIQEDEQCHKPPVHSSKADLLRTSRILLHLSVPPLHIAAFKPLQPTNFLVSHQYMSLYSLPSDITFPSIEGERLNRHSNCVRRKAKTDLETRKSDTKRSLHSAARERGSTVDLSKTHGKVLLHHICSNGDLSNSEHSNHEAHELVGKFHVDSIHDVEKCWQRSTKSSTSVRC